MSDGAGTRSGRGRALVRVLVSALLLGFLAWKVPLRDVSAALGRVPPLGVALCILTLAVQTVVGAMRWRRMLIRTGERPALGTLIEDSLVGAAYNLVLPSSVGGDVVRAHRAGKRLSTPHHAWSTALFERMIGLPTLAAVAAPGILVVPGGDSLLWPTVAIAAVSAVLLVVADAPLRFASRLLLSRSPAVAGMADGVARDLAGPLATPGARAEAIAWSLLYQVLSITILAAAVLPAGDLGLVRAIYAGVPLVVIGTMIPVSAGGFGVRESLFVVVLARLGVDRATALALSLIWLGTSVLLAIPGVALALARPVEGEKG